MMVPNLGETNVLVMANCTHHSLALALRKSGVFADVQSAELYSMSEQGRAELADNLAQFGYVLTLEHGEGFGPLSTTALRDRLGERLFSLPTPFFSGLMPDMAYLRYGDDIARTAAVLGDYHSALLLEEVRSGFPQDDIVRRYVSGEAFDRLDVRGVWNDSLGELKAREKEVDIAISPCIERAAADGNMAGQFLSFNHPTEGLINYIAGEFIRRVSGGTAAAAALTREEHNLYADAFWPLHPAVAERLGLRPPQPDQLRFKQPARLGGAYMDIGEFVRRSVAFFTEDHEPEKFTIATPHYLTKHIAAVQPEKTGPIEKQKTIPKGVPVAKEIVLTHFGRSGSTVLGEMLKQHSKIAWLSEFFSVKWINDQASYDFTLEEMMDMIGAEVEKIQAQSPGVLVGHEIKLMNFLQNPSCNMMDYARATANPERYFHVILRRRNVLKRICSVYKAAQTKVYHIQSGDTEYRAKTFKIDFSNLVDYDTGQKGSTFPELIDKALERENQVIANMKHAGIRHLDLVYEDDIESDPQQAYAKVVAALRLDPEPSRVSLSKTGAGLRGELENYDELEQQMRGSDHAWMLS